MKGSWAGTSAPAETGKVKGQVKVKVALAGQARAKAGGETLPPASSLVPVWSSLVPEAVKGRCEPRFARFSLSLRSTLDSL